MNPSTFKYFHSVASAALRDIFYSHARSTWSHPESLEAQGVQRKTFHILKSKASCQPFLSTGYLEDHSSCLFPSVLKANHSVGSAALCDIFLSHARSLTLPRGAGYAEKYTQKRPSDQKINNLILFFISPIPEINHSVASAALCDIFYSHAGSAGSHRRRLSHRGRKEKLIRS